MRLTPSDVTREINRKTGAKGVFYRADCTKIMPELIERYAGKIKCVYMDPPYLTGKSFFAEIRAGEADWKKSRGSYKAEAYTDKKDTDDYYSMMEKVVSGVYEMLRDDGAMFLHVDYRAHARLRLICDGIFGEKNFVNEIIWAYHSGGMAVNSFPRKHDVILFYKKSDAFTFHLDRVLESRVAPPDNHMKKGVDSDGRTFRTIRSGGRTYTYYDDEPVPPTDVWTDISHLQQKDSERTGYPTQKPLKLLRRIENSVCDKGDIVMDLFAGSGTSLVCANMNGYDFVGADISPIAQTTLRRRLPDCDMEYVFDPVNDDAACDIEYQTGVGVTYVSLTGFEYTEPNTGVSGLDAVNSWAIGYIEDGTFISESEFSRAPGRSKLSCDLRMPENEGVIGIRISDVSGIDRYYALCDREFFIKA